MGIKDNFTQAMKELTNPRPSDARKEVRDVASYMNDTADALPFVIKSTRFATTIIASKICVI